MPHLEVLYYGHVTMLASLSNKDLSPSLSPQAATEYYDAQKGREGKNGTRKIGAGRGGTKEGTLSITIDRRGTANGVWWFTSWLSRYMRQGLLPS